MPPRRQARCAEGMVARGGEGEAAERSAAVARAAQVSLWISSRDPSACSGGALCYARFTGCTCPCCPAPGMLARCAQGAVVVAGSGAAAERAGGSVGRGLPRQSCAFPRVSPSACSGGGLCCPRVPGGLSSGDPAPERWAWCSQCAGAGAATGTETETATATATETAGNGSKYLASSMGQPQSCHLQLCCCHCRRPAPLAIAGLPPRGRLTGGNSFQEALAAEARRRGNWEQVDLLSQDSRPVPPPPPTPPPPLPLPLPLLPAVHPGGRGPG